MGGNKPVIVNPPTDGQGHPDAGWHNAVCCEVIDLGFKETDWGLREHVRFLFQLEARNPKTGRRWIIAMDLRKTLNAQSKLRRFLETWRARSLWPDELNAGINLSRWEGAGAKVFIDLLPARPGFQYPLAVIREVVPLEAGVVVVPEDYRALVGAAARRRARQAVKEERDGGE